MPLFASRIRRAAIAAIALGALLGVGLSTPAFAASASTHSLTVAVTSKSGAALSGLHVYAIPVADGQELLTIPEVAGKAVTGKAGSYAFSALADVTYTLYFETSGTTAKSAFSQLLGGESSVSRARLIPATTTSLSVSLATNATITGKITSPSGSALKGAVAQAYEFDGSTWVPYSYGVADSKGVYALHDIDPASYKFEFYSPTGSYAPVFSGGALTLDAATATAITVGSTTTLNARFGSHAGSISGTTSWYYVNSGPYGMSKVVAAAYPVLEQHGVATRVDYDRATYSKAAGSTGKWKIAGLADGDYVVELLPYYYNQPQAFLGWGGSGSTSIDLSEASIFTVDGGSARVVAPSTLYAGATGAAIQVFATSPTNVPIAGAHVLLQRDSDPNEYYRGTTGSKGTLDIGRQKVGKSTTSVIQPGKFTLTVTSTDGSFEPYSQSIELDPGYRTWGVSLQPTLTPPGFVAPPTLDTSATPVGTSYTVSAQASRYGATLSYQWLRDGHVIYGATGKSYVSRASDLGTQLSVRVRSYSRGFTDAVATVSVPGVTTGGAKPTAVTPPSVTSDSEPHAGSTLHIAAGAWSVPGLDFAYAWYRDGVLLPNTGRDYVVSDDDLGATFTAKVTATKVGFPDSDPVDATNSLTPTPGPAITPLARFVVNSRTVSVPKGSIRYTVAPGLWTATRSQFSYQWTLGGTPVSTAPSYVASTSAASLAKPLAVTVSASAAGWQDGSATQVVRKATSLVTALERPIATTQVGGAALAATSPVPMGAPISVSSGTWTHIGITPPGLSVRYQWLRTAGRSAAVAITGATSATYTPSYGDLATKLSVRVTASSDEWTDATATVPAGTVGTATALVDHQPTLTLDGSAAPHTLLEVESTNTWTALGATVTWQWSQCLASTCSASSPASDYTKITGATTSATQVTAAQATHWLRVTATATRIGYTTATQSLPPIHVLDLTTMPVTRIPVIQSYFTDDVVQAGSTAFAYPIGSEVDTDTRTMKWQVCSADCSVESSWHAGTGALNLSYGGGIAYIPSGADESNGTGRLRVVETMTKAGYTPATATSADVPITEGVFDTGGTMSLLHDTGSPTWSVNFPDVTAAQNGTQTVQWYSGDVAQAPGPSYTITAADAGKPVFAVLTYDVPGFREGVYTLVAQTGDVSGVSAASETILGGKVNQPLTLSEPMPWTLPSNPFAHWQVVYDWQVGTGGGRTNGPYSPAPYQIGGDIAVVVHATSPLYGHLDLTVTTTSKVAMGDPLDPATPPTLSWTGDLVPGTAVKVIGAPTLSPSDLTAFSWPIHLQYRWDTSTDGISWTPATTAPVYVPALADGGHWLRATLTASRSGYPTYVYTTPATRMGLGPTIQQLAAPVLSGDFRVGGKVTLDEGDWSAGVHTTVEWLLNGAPLPGVTKDTWVPLARNYGDELSVRITASQNGRLDVVTESNRERIGQASAPVVVSAPAISGKTALSVTTGGWSVGGLTFHYQWRVAGTDVDGATASTFALPSGIARSSVTVTVTTERFGYADGSATAH